jgi:transposase InsO family protein
MVRKHHSVSYQDQACKLVTDEGMSQVDAAKQLGIHPVTLRKWLTKRGLVTPVEIIEPVFKYIECWYNRRRRHSAIGYVSPEQFEASLN